ncbi:MAG: glycosyltransferase [Candidatus Dormibacteria bacterium]
MTLPSISVLIPVLNAQQYLDGCLRSLREQDYPADRIEVILADAGSTDRTLEIAARHGVTRVVPNPGITGEAARAILNRLVTSDLVLSIDSDNYLCGRDWLRRMVEPLSDPTVFASEPIRWDYRPDDAPLNRYFSLSGVNDPVSLFMGNYGRWCHLHGRWTAMPHHEEVHPGYLVAVLQPGSVPTMGANGYLVRTAAILEVTEGDHYFDIDAVNQLVDRGHLRVAKVDVAIGHHFARNLSALRRKTRRRIHDYLHWRTQRSYPWTSRGRGALVRFTLATVLVAPLLWQAARGYRRVRDWAWLYHVPVCWLTLWIYATALLTAPIRRQPYSRAGWTH